MASGGQDLATSISARASSFIDRARHSGMAKNALFYTVNILSQIGLQLGYFILISRAFGPSGYGVFATATAVAMLAAVFVGWGSERVLIQRVAVAPSSFRAQFGNGLIQIALTAAPLSIVAFVVLSMLNIDPLTWRGITLIVLAECIFRKLTTLALSSFFAHDMAVRHLVLNIAANAIRFGAALLAILYADPLTLDVWAVWYFAGGVLTAGSALLMACAYLGTPQMRFDKSDLNLGFLYSLELASVSGLKDLDKPVIVQTLGPAAAGLYAAAFRIIEAAAAPLRGILYSAYTRYFRHAETSVNEGIGFGFRVLGVVGGLAVAVAGALYICAGFLPILLGEDYRETVDLVRILAIYPILIGALGVGADIMRAIGLQQLRVILLTVSFLSVIPVTWAGAAY
ncbi:MAG: oligosaccharide flippase family protein, partial [Pseudomonadota bacterium]